MEQEALRVVIDTNELVFALTGPAEGASYRLLELPLAAREQFVVRIPQTIATESVRDLPNGASGYEEVPEGDGRW